MNRVALFLLVLVAVSPLMAGDPAGDRPRPSVAKSAGAAEAISVTFVAVPGGAAIRYVGSGQGALDLGPVSANGATREGVSITRRGSHFLLATSFGLKLGGDGSQGGARLAGFITVPSALHKVRIDGVRLSLAPQVISARIKPGAVSQHRLEIEVPVEAPERVADIFNCIAFQVLPE